MACSSVCVFAAPANIDQWAQYDGSGWNYNSSSGTFSWNNNMANSSEFVVLSYLRDLYSSVKTYNDNLKSGWLFTSNGYSYPSGWSGSFYKIALDMINAVDTSIENNLHSNLSSYSSYPLYNYKNFIDSALNNSQSFSSTNFIMNFISGISSLNTNISYIANQFYADNVSGTYNARSLLNQALHKYVDSSTADYTTILNNIKLDTANLSGIKTDTANLSGIKNDTANLSAILSFVNDFKTTNHSDITTFANTNHADIISVDSSVDSFKSANHADITSFQEDYNNISWSELNNKYLGVKTNITGEYLNSPLSIASNVGAYVFYDNIYNNGINLYKIRVPLRLYLASSYDKLDITLYAYNTSKNTYHDVSDLIYSYYCGNNYTEIIFSNPLIYYGFDANSSIKSVFYISTQSTMQFTNNSYGKAFALAESKDYYDVSNNNLLVNVFDLLKQAKEMFFDDDALEAKKANSSQTTTVLNNYTGSGQASASASDFSDISNSVDSVKDGVNTGVSVSNILNIFNNNDGYGFWSDATKQELNTTRSNRANFKAGRAGSTPLYDAKISELHKAMGVNYE